MKTQCLSITKDIKGVLQIKACTSLLSENDIQLDNSTPLMLLERGRKDSTREREIR
jgi:hypothetical protein